MQNEDQNSLYKVLSGVVPKSVHTNKNKKKSWSYGYDPKYDIVVISKDGTLGDIYLINNLKIGLPKTPTKSFQLSSKKENQYWQPFQYPKDLQRIKSIFQWNEMPGAFKTKWVDYIETEFDRRENGFWFMNNGKPTYITGSHYIFTMD